VDNNCNGQVDDGLGTTTCGVGQCARTAPACIGGVVQTCVPGTPAPEESCDGLDNDCNGQVDDGFGTTTCGVGQCARTTPVCVGGVVRICVPGTPAPETCDGRDNNCNGQVDEGFGTTSCGAGACLRVVQNCGGGVPQSCAPGIPSPEICNGIDDDCNGSTDEGFGNTICGLGLCQRTVSNCVAGVPQTCVPGTPGFESPATLDSCFDGIDNNCNGVVDLDCASELSAGGRSIITGNLTCGSDTNITATSSNNTYECVQEASLQTAYQLTALFTYSTVGVPAGTNYDLRLEGFRSAGANDTFGFSSSTRATPGNCAASEGGTAVILSVSKPADDDVLQATDLGVAEDTFCIKVIGSRDGGGSDSIQDTLTLDRLFVFPTPVAAQDISFSGDVGSVISGSYASTQRSDDAREVVREESPAGSNRLLHTWQFRNVPAGEGHRLHLEGSTAGANLETFNFYYSTDPATWSPTNPLTGFTLISGASIKESSEASGDSSSFGGATLAGTVYIRVIDAKRTNDQNTLSIDHLAIKTAP
jgi:hypothetical protein